MKWVPVLASGPGHSRYGSLKQVHILASDTIIQVLQKLGADFEQQLLQCSDSRWTEEFGQ